MLHNKSRKSKGEKQFISKIYMQEMMQLNSSRSSVQGHTNEPAPACCSGSRIPLLLQKNREGPRRPSLKAGDKMIPSQPSFE
jgi:hypothetical protein